MTSSTFAGKTYLVKTLALVFSLSFAFSTQATNNSNFENGELHQSRSNDKVLESVMSMSQDTGGLMWFGTSRGLTRFDGTRTKTFTPLDQRSAKLGHSWVNKIFRDNMEIFWIGTKSGLQRFDPKLEEFVVEPTFGAALKQFDSSDVRYVVGDSFGYVWAGTSKRIIRFDSSSGQYFEPDIWNGMSAATVNCLYAEASGDLWIGYDGGIARIERNSLNVTHFRKFLDADGRPISELVYPSAIHRTNRDEVLIGTQLGLAKLNFSPGNKSAHIEMFDATQIPKIEVFRVLSSPDGSVWVSSSKRGLYRRLPGSLVFEQQLDGLFPKDAACDANIASLYVAQGGVLWIGGWQREPCHLNTEQVSIRSFISKEYASKGKRLRGFRAITEDENGLLVLTRDKQLVRPFAPEVGPEMYRGKTSLKKIFNFFGRVWGLDSKGIGLLSLREAELQYRCTFQNELLLHVESLVTDVKGSVWFSTEEGLTLCDTLTGRVEVFRHQASTKNSLFLDENYPLAVDWNGNLWSGTHLGLQKYDHQKREFSFFSNANIGSEQIPLNTVHAIATNSRGEIWIGVESGLLIGRNSVDGGFEFDKWVKLPAIYAIQFSEGGDAWLSSETGLIHVDPNGGLLRFLNEKEGGEAGEFPGMESFRSKNGEIIFSSSNFAYYFHPKLLKNTNLEPHIIVTGFRADSGNDHDAMPKNVLNFLPAKAKEIFLLPSDTYAVHVDLADLNFSKNSLTKLQVKLEGFDQRWRDVDVFRMQVTYMNLPQGEYKLLARATYQLSFSERENIILQLSIPPPVWKTWWMKVIFALLAGLMLMILYQYKVRSLKRAKSSLEAIVRARTTELAEQNKNKSKFIADAAHDLRQPMQAIGNLLEAAVRSLSRGDLVKSKELLSLASKATELMRSSFHSVLELSRVETGMISPRYENLDLDELIRETLPTFEIMARDVEVRLRYKGTKKGVQVILTDRHFTSRILTNLVGNAIKYRDTSKPVMAVEIRSVTLKNSVRLYVLDNGVGIPSSDIQNIFRPFFQVANMGHDREKGIGLGLSIVDAMCKAMKGHDLGLSTKLARGTKVWVDFPFGDQVLSQENSVSALVGSTSGVSGVYVLYVEDDDLVRESTFSILSAYGLLCDSFRSFEELSRALPTIERTPDLILTDHRLSQQYDSGDVIDLIRGSFDFEVPAIILTGESVEIESERAKKANLILYKPVGVEQLISAISSLRSNMPSDHED